MEICQNSDVMSTVEGSTVFWVEFGGAVVRGTSALQVHVHRYCAWARGG